MPENEDFCLSFELFSWVSDFLSFGVLEFFRGCTKKKPAGIYNSKYLTSRGFLTQSIKLKLKGKNKKYSKK